MTVQEIFALRKQGCIEEAYEAIRAKYATYRGKYTTLCMFWTARDIFNLRIQQGRIEEAAKIYKALQRVLPNINDRDGRAAAFMQFAAHRLSATVPASSPSLAPAGSPSASVLSGSPGLAPAGSPSASVLSGSPAATVPASFPAVPPASSVLSDSVAEGLNRGQQAVLDCITANSGYNIPKIEAATGIPYKSIERHVSALIAKQLIEHRGSKKTGGYYAK